jgi:release factor glutamine methyltransferase
MPAPDASAPPTLGEAVRAAALRLRQAGIAGAGDDARRLASAVLGLAAAQLLSAPERRLTRAEAGALACAVTRRAQREPVSRILGAREFYGRSFALSPATLDPRADSETLVAATLELVREEGRLSAPLRIVDVGTGTGCLLLTLLLELTQATGVGTDISVPALATARRNARALGIAQRCAWVAADALAALTGSFDVLVCNPPYVRSAEIPLLDPEVARYDPQAALDGGSDGLALYRRLAGALAGIVPDGWVVFEVGHDQADAVAALLSAPEVLGRGGPPRVFADVAGKRRCVACRTRMRPVPVTIGAENP